MRNEAFQKSLKCTLQEFSLSTYMKAPLRLSPDDRVIWSSGDNRGQGAIAIVNTDTDLSPGDITQTHREARGDLSAGYSLFKTQLY